MPPVLVSDIPVLQDQDSTEEGSKDRANDRQRLEVNANQRADTVPAAGAAAAAFGRGARRGSVGASLLASAVRGNEAGSVAVGASELHQRQASDLGASVVLDGGGHVGGSLAMSQLQVATVSWTGSTYHAGDGSARGGGDSRSHKVITTAGPLRQVPVGQEGRLGDERGGTSCSLLLLSGLVDRGQGGHVDLEVLLLQEIVCDMLAICSTGISGLVFQGRLHWLVHTVLQECDLRRAVNSDESVLIRLLSVLIHQTAGKHGHLVAVQNRNVGESPGLDVVATVLGEEDRDVCVGEFLSEGAVA